MLRFTFISTTKNLTKWLYQLQHLIIQFLYFIWVTPPYFVKNFNVYFTCGEYHILSNNKHVRNDNNKNYKLLINII